MKNIDKFKYYDFQSILEFLGFEYEFKTNNKGFPFSKGVDDVNFSWGQILIPKHGIREMVQYKISDIREKEAPLSKITMMYQIPFVTSQGKTGIINKNICLRFEYGKEYKYGDINKSIYEVCFFILEHAIPTNDFFLITDDVIQEFMSFFVINNQYGLGCSRISSPCMEKFCMPVKSNNDDGKELKCND